MALQARGHWFEPEDAVHYPGCVTNCLTIGAFRGGQRRTPANAATWTGEEFDQSAEVLTWLHTEEVTGSIPVSPTQVKGRFLDGNRPF
jgi:hypothetical protein